MRRTGKRASEPTIGSEGMSQLLMTYSIFMTRGPHRIAREMRREPNYRVPAKAAYFRMNCRRKKNGHPKVPVRKQARFRGFSLLPFGNKGAMPPCISPQSVLPESYMR